MSALLRFISVASTLVLLVSFGMFVSDQAHSGSKKTVAQIAAGDSADSGVAAPAVAPEPAKKKHGPVRNAIDDVNEKLVAPFDGIVAGASPWKKHITETLLAFLVFGVGIGFAARYAATRGV